jgi:translation initiation factor IF-3
MTIMFSGREMNNTQRGLDLMQQIAAAVEEFGTVEKKPNLEGRFMTMFVAPKKNN